MDDELISSIFPYPPYSIQLQFVKFVYNVLHQAFQSHQGSSNVLILESPTGTGKSASLLCSLLYWLETDGTLPSFTLEPSPSTHSSDPGPAEPDWVRAHRQKLAFQKQMEAHEAHVRKIRKHGFALNRLRSSAKRAPQHGLPSLPSPKRPQLAHLPGQDDAYLPEKPALEAAAPPRGSSALLSGGGAPSPGGAWSSVLQSSDPRDRLRLISQQLGLDGSSEDDDGPQPLDAPGAAALPPVPVRKIWFTSRTHSQLSQTINELRRTAFKDRIKAIFVGSRNSLCVNSEIRRDSPSSSALNERCLDLLEERKSGRPGCPYWKLDDEARQQLFRDQILAQINDIEDLLQQGRQHRICPFYTTRSALPFADLIALPYQLLFHAQSRESLGIAVKSDVVVVDEAHNLLSAINDLHSVVLDLDQVKAAIFQLSSYTNRYHARLLPQHLVLIKQIQVILNAFHTELLHSSSSPTATPIAPTASHADFSLLLTINDFLFRLRIESINLFPLIEWVSSANLVNKLRGFSTDVLTKDGALSEDAAQSSLSAALCAHIQPMSRVLSFLQALTNTDQDGRVLIQHQLSPSLRFALLNPEKHITEVVEQSFATLLAGGTLHPVDLLANQLFPSLPKDHLYHFSCGHVIPAQHLTTCVLSTGPSGVDFDFSFQHRSEAQTDELGRVMANFSNVVPQGIICFFPSYALLQQTHARWTASGQIAKFKKQIFFESSSSTSTTSTTTTSSSTSSSSSSSSPAASEHLHSSAPQDPFQAYQQHIVKSAEGAILLAVIGGKLSEGINFSDGLARCVVVVGIPFPNPYDPLLQERLQRAMKDHHSEPSVLPRQKQQLYESLAMNAVNQSIGRAIRHRNDYASIVLVDSRYSRTNLIDLLPQWIRSYGITVNSFGTIFSKLVAFYANLKNK